MRKNKRQDNKQLETFISPWNIDQHLQETPISSRIKSKPLTTFFPQGRNNSQPARTSQNRHRRQITTNIKQQKQLFVQSENNESRWPSQSPCSLRKRCHRITKTMNITFNILPQSQSRQSDRFSERQYLNQPTSCRLFRPPSNRIHCLHKSELQNTYSQKKKVKGGQVLDNNSIKIKTQSVVISHANFFRSTFRKIKSNKQGYIIDRTTNIFTEFVNREEKDRRNIRKNDICYLKEYIKKRRK